VSRHVSRRGRSVARNACGTTSYQNGVSQEPGPRDAAAWRWKGMMEHGECRQDYMVEAPGPQSGNRRFKSFPDPSGGREKGLAKFVAVAVAARNAGGTTCRGFDSRRRPQGSRSSVGRAVFRHRLSSRHLECEAVSRNTANLSPCPERRGECRRNYITRWSRVRIPPGSCKRACSSDGRATCMFRYRLSPRRGRFE
jgi:hypothetical protein